MSKVIGPDVSFYQNSPTTPQGIDFVEMNQEADFVIIRAGQNTWTDPDFAYNYKAAKAAGLPRGSYWFYDSRSTPISQAKLFTSLLADDPPECGAWLDLEESYGGPYYGWSNWILCLDYLRLTLPRVGIYTGWGYWSGYRNGVVKVPGKDIYQPRMTADALTYFKSFELWIANYGVSFPNVPLPWTSYVFWQYTASGNGALYGVESKEIDLNEFFADYATFRNYFDLPPVVQPPTEVNLNQWYRVNTTKLNFRNGPGTSYLDLGDLFTNDQIETTAGSMGGWVNILQIVRVNGTVEVPAAGIAWWCSSAYCVAIAPPVIQPPTDAKPDYITAHWVNGTEKKYIPE
jgi:GH25 family lysozyme M1 (1,4-beta-N-acetylmuramidase)